MGIARSVGSVALLFGVVACGGGDGGGDEASPTADSSLIEASGDGGQGTVEDLEAAATAQFEAFLAGDDSTYFDLLSRACRERLGFAAVGGHLDGRYFTAGLDGVDLSALSVSDVTVEGGGSEAMVTLVIDGPKGDQFREAVIPHNWIHEGGGWHMDDCDDFREAQGGLAGVGMDRDDPLGLGGVADVNNWLVALTYVDPNADELVVETGGDPATEGHQLFAVQLNVGYNGGAPSVVFGDELGFALVNGDMVYDAESDCIGPESSLYVDPDTAVGPGESVGLPYVCREVSIDDVDGLQLRVDHIPTGGEWWFRLDGS